MPKYLIDANLPYYFSIWNTPDYIHQNDIDDEWLDSQIWDYAIEHRLTIITKDSDFSNRILLKEPPPKVIHIRFGNVKMKQFFSIINKVWEEVLILNKDHKLINVFQDRIEAME
jgi:predicted nuclease of predicted toxin-antitoxin system